MRKVFIAKEKKKKKKKKVKKKPELAHWRLNPRCGFMFFETPGLNEPKD